MGTFAFKGVFPDAGDGKCQLDVGPPGKRLQCGEESIATLKDEGNSIRLCENHAEQMEINGKPIVWD
jgi:hypothetical protein